jgi:hypothetical protein
MNIPDNEQNYCIAALGFLFLEAYHVEQQQLTSCYNKVFFLTRNLLYTYFPFPALMDPTLMFY